MNHINTTPPLGEHQVIQRIRQVFLNAGLTTSFDDDCAELRSPTHLVSTDTLVEGIHFDRRWDSPYDIGRQAAVCNMSDIAASGGKPQWITWSLSVPRSWTLVDIEGLSSGLASLCAQYTTPLIGGNLTQTMGPMVINVTIGGACVSDRPILRSGAKVGDTLFVSGHLGNSALGYLKPSPVHRALRHTWRPHIAEATILAKHPRVSAMMDISDGLLLDAHRLGTSSQVGLSLNSSTIPVSELYRQNYGSDKTVAMTGGEDYVLLFTCAKDEDMPHWAHPIGQCVGELGVFVDGQVVEPKGHDHFAGVDQS